MSQTQLWMRLHYGEEIGPSRPIASPAAGFDHVMSRPEDIPRITDIEIWAHWPEAGTTRSWYFNGPFSPDDPDRIDQCVGAGCCFFLNLAEACRSRDIPHHTDTIIYGHAT